MPQKRHIATEQLSFNENMESLAEQRKYTEIFFARLKCVSSIHEQAKVLDIGAAGGTFLIACNMLGYEGYGIEPWEGARTNALKLSKHLNIPIQIMDGTAECIPYEDNTFDVIHANSVLEHTLDIEKALGEIFRVLKPGGVFWFYTASSMCPFQGEIRGFPLFGWYPDPLKRRIMLWAKQTRPDLIGFSETPAINWFTPRKTHALLRKHGFTQIYDRWDIRGETEGGRLYLLALHLIRKIRVVKLCADVVVPDCSYAAIK